MADVLKRVDDAVIKWLWSPRARPLGWAGSSGVRVLRLIYVVVSEFQDSRLALTAMSLVYTSLLSLVPLLAVSFSVLKAFGAHNLLDPVLREFLAPFGTQGADMTRRILGAVDNVRVGVLGGIGLVSLLYTVVSLIEKIEGALNEIWGARHMRSMGRRFADYLSVVLVGPVLLFSAVALTASAQSNAVVRKVLAFGPLGFAFYMGSKLVPYLIVSAAFTFLYFALPSTRVRFRSALVGGVIAGVLWQTTEWIFAVFIVTSASYSAIYSGFAIPILFFVWLYMNWRVLLVGAGVSFYHQHPHLLTVRRRPIVLSNRLKEKLALFIVYHVGERYLHGRSPWTVQDLIDEHASAVPVEPLQRVIDMLEAKGLIAVAGDDRMGYRPARDPATIPLEEVLDAVRSAEEEIYSIAEGTLSVPAATSLVNEIEGARRSTLGNRTVRDFVDGQPA